MARRQRRGLFDVLGDLVDIVQDVGASQQQNRNQTTPKPDTKKPEAKTTIPRNISPEPELPEFGPVPQPEKRQTIKEVEIAPEPKLPEFDPVPQPEKRQTINEVEIAPKPERKEIPEIIEPKEIPEIEINTNDLDDLIKTIDQQEPEELDVVVVTPKNPEKVAQQKKWKDLKDWINSEDGDDWLDDNGDDNDDDSLFIDGENLNTKELYDKYYEKLRLRFQRSEKRLRLRHKKKQREVRANHRSILQKFKAKSHQRAKEDEVFANNDDMDSFFNNWEDIIEQKGKGRGRGKGHNRKKA
ncbi:MAG: hypothetical protein ACPGXL_03970 [Chitinophagales bacterium]